VLTVGPDLINPLGYAWQKDSAGSNALQKVFRQLNAIDRNYFRAFNEIRRLQRPPAVSVPGPEGAPAGSGHENSLCFPTPQMEGEFGFVPPNAAISSPMAPAVFPPAPGRPGHNQETKSCSQPGRAPGCRR
jgi:hypothetical protein